MAFVILYTSLYKKLYSHYIQYHGNVFEQMIVLFCVLHARKDQIFIKYIQRYVLYML